MELDIKPKLESKELILSKSDGNSQINLYKKPPFGQLTLEECEDLFRQRLEALFIIERNDFSSDKQALCTKALRDIKSYVYKTNCIVLRSNDPQQRRLDHFSHMLVRMYCVHNSNLWDWFKSCERKLLHYRLKDQACSLSGGQLESILKSFDFDFERVLGPELSELCKENIIGWNKRDQDSTDVFRVKFTDALKFIARRSVALQDGFALLTRYEIISVVCDVFERYLDSELNFARQHLNMDHLQTQQLLESLAMVYLDYQEKFEEEKRRAKREQDGDNQSPYRIDIENVEEFVKDHYPPCMRYMHEALLEDHHLKHQGRLLYGAFLRSGGVDMDSAIEFWRREFTKKIPNDKFERDYKYNIRHLYGREGHKKALSCFSCDKIINDNAPGPSEKHGCPFKHFDDEHLKVMLSKHGLKTVDIESIFLFRNDKDYRMACSHYYKFMKGPLPSEPIKTPSQFYYESKRLALHPPSEQEPLSDVKEGAPDQAITPQDATHPEDDEFDDFE